MLLPRQSNALFASPLKLPALLIALHAYVGLRLIPDLPLSVSGRALAVVLLVLFCGLMGLAVTHRRIREPVWADRAAWVGMSAAGLFSSLLVFTLWAEQ